MNMNKMRDEAYFGNLGSDRIESILDEASWRKEFDDLKNRMPFEDPALLEIIAKDNCEKEQNKERN